MSHSYDDAWCQRRDQSRIRIRLSHPGLRGVSRIGCRHMCLRRCLQECGSAGEEAGGETWWFSGSAACRGRWQLRICSGAGAACACPIDAPSPSWAALPFLSPCFRLGASAMCPPRRRADFVTLLPARDPVLPCAAQQGGTRQTLVSHRSGRSCSWPRLPSLHEVWTSGFGVDRSRLESSQHHPTRRPPRGMPSPPLA